MEVQIWGDNLYTKVLIDLLDRQDQHLITDVAKYALCRRKYGRGCLKVNMHASSAYRWMYVIDNGIAFLGATAKEAWSVYANRANIPHSSYRGPTN